MDTGLDVERVIGSAYERYREPLQRYLVSITRDPAAAEDLTQDAFLRLIGEVRAGRLPDNPGAWLHRVGHNLAMSRGRRMTVADRRRADLVEWDWTPSPETLSVAGEEQRAVRAALDTLDRCDRVALILSSQGYRGAEIARTIGAIRRCHADPADAGAGQDALADAGRPAGLTLQPGRNAPPLSSGGRGRW